MSRFWKTLAVAIGTVAVLGGTLLLMGNLSGSQAHSVQLEQSRLAALARHWEYRIEVARSTLRDQVVRSGLLAALEHPDDWSVWRIQSKLDVIRSAWGREPGAPRGYALLTDDGHAQATAGDTVMLAEAARVFQREGADIVFLRRGKHAETLALQYYNPSQRSDLRPGRLIALAEAGDVLSQPSDAPREWILLSGPGESLIAASSSTARVMVTPASWPLLLAEKEGAVRQSNGTTLCFARVAVPGMSPLLLVQTPPAPSRTTRNAALILVGAGVGVLMLSSRIRRRENARPAAAEVHDDTESSAGENIGFRYIFQAVENPLCVINSSGCVARANRKAQDWLRLQRGKPSDRLRFRQGGQEWLAADFFARAAEDPAAVSGRCRSVLDDSAAAGVIQATRLYRDDEGHGPVLLQFIPDSTERDDSAYRPPEPAVERPVTDYNCCPFPVLCVTADGLICSFNDAARQISPRLDETPILSEILPALDGGSLETVLGEGNGFGFESLFGSSTYEFEVVHHRDKILLYGHRVSESKRLEIELKQAQENFYALCSLVPAAVLLVDSRDHSVLEANAEASDLFGMTPADLRGRLLDWLLAEPCDFSAEDEVFTAISLTGGQSRCLMHYELIKIEGVPTLLVVLERTPEPSQPESAPGAAETSQEETPPPPEEPAPLPLGPGLLITLNPTVREVARKLLEKTGHPCESFSSLDDVTVWLITHEVRPELVAIDLTDFDDITNWIEDLRSRCGNVPCLGFTDGETYPLPNGSLNTFLAKPFDLESLSEALSVLQLESSLLPAPQN